MQHLNLQQLMPVNLQGCMQQGVLKTENVNALLKNWPANYFRLRAKNY
jgi:hypothetical protein